MAVAHINRRPVQGSAGGTRPLTLLFLNAGRRVELIRLFQDAMERLKLRGRIVATDIVGTAPGLYAADARRLLPRSRAPGFAEALRRLCRKERVRLIVPLIDPDLPVLAALKPELEARGTRVLVSSPEAIAICRDKVKTAEFLKANGFPTPAALSLREARRHAFPLMVKPRDGSAGVNAFKVNNRRELAFFVRYVSDPIIQPWLDGVEITTDVFSDEAGNPLAAVPRRRLAVRSGEVSVGRVERNPALEKLCMAVARALGTTGLVNVQAMVSGRSVFITEINPRYGGGCPLSVRAGAPFVEWTLALALGRPLSKKPFMIKDGLTLMRFDESFFIPSEKLLS